MLHMGSIVPYVEESGKAAHAMVIFFSVLAPVWVGSANGRCRVKFTLLEYNEPRSILQ